MYFASSPFAVKEASLHRYRLSLTWLVLSQDFEPFLDFDVAIPGLEPLLHGIGDSEKRSSYAMSVSTNGGRKMVFAAICDLL